MLLILSKPFLVITARVNYWQRMLGAFLWTSKSSKSVINTITVGGYAPDDVRDVFMNLWTSKSSKSVINTITVGGYAPDDARDVFMNLWTGKSSKSVTNTITVGRYAPVLKSEIPSIHRRVQVSLSSYTRMYRHGLQTL